MKLEDIKGLGAKRIAALKASGIEDPLDLLLLFPSAYFDREAVIDWDTLKDGDDVIFLGEIVEKPIFKRVRKGLSFVKAKMTSFGKTLTCTWFNQDFVYRQLVTKSHFIIGGKVKRYSKSIEISAPRIIPERDVKILPVYKLPKGLPQSVMTDAVAHAIKGLRVNGFVKDEVASEFGIMPLSAAVKAAHFPSDIPQAFHAVKSIATERLAYTVSIYNLVKGETEKRVNKYGEHAAELSSAIKGLPFLLTDDQNNAIKKITERFRSPQKMNMLLQGDVGSGKTIVAFLAAYYAALSGYQTAIMAPTEILALQHASNAKAFFGPLGISVACLTGTLCAKDRSSVLDDIKSGRASVVIGTHALIGNSVIYKNLGFTVTDEQHRFGVCQRGSLENKTEGNTDNLVMSATPIPRTLALSLYGQLETVNLHSKPTSADSIMTAIVPQNKLADMYKYIADKANSGEKTYIVCPRIDSDEEISAIGLYEELKRGILGKVGIRLLHGKMKDKEKETVMREFAFGKINVLVATTVIEVGIDVSSATTMAIFGADRLGLSQLHQLRGRIGRRGQKSYCFIIEDGCNIPERLKFLCACNDGFRLAEYDFDARGAGDFLGVRQHGKSRLFADVKIDAELITKAKGISERMLGDERVRSELIARAAEREEFIRSISLS